MIKRISTIIVICSLLVTYCITIALGEEELIPVQSQDKWGYANNKIEIVIPAQWDYASYFRVSQTAIVGVKQSDGNLLYGLINTKGDFLIPCAYNILAGESEAFFGGENGYYLVVDPKSSLCGYYDIQNNFFCEPVYDDVDIWYKNEENIISVAKIGAVGRAYIHANTGEQIGPDDYIETYPWYRTAALCISMDGKKWIQFIDGSRKEIDCEYDIRSDISHGLFIIANQKGQYSLMNLQANIVANWSDYIEITPMGDFYGRSGQCSGIVYCQVDD